jgi:hypothetical protein
MDKLKRQLAEAEAALEARKKPSEDSGPRIVGEGLVIDEWVRSLFGDVQWQCESFANAWHVAVRHVMWSQYLISWFSYNPEGTKREIPCSPAGRNGWYRVGTML